jgi:hypothetical protein
MSCKTKSKFALDSATSGSITKDLSRLNLKRKCSNVNYTNILRIIVINNNISYCLASAGRTSPGVSRKTI